MTKPYFAFLLRLWQSPAGERWQASLEDPHTRQITGFASLEQLYAYLGELQSGAQGDATLDERAAYTVQRTHENT